jgi:protein-S-isoprenylcysteine O-methyltransferase Ste14
MNVRPPLGAALGTLVGAPLFIGATVLYVPWTLSGWIVRRPFLGWVAWRWIGIAMIAAAVPVMLDFLVRFVGEGHGTPMPMAPPRRLVVNGTFRFVRNPGYLAALGVMVGQGLLLGSVPVLIYAVGMGAVFHLFVVGYEEPALRRKFGAEYETYRHEVRRWIPRRARAGHVGRTQA